MRSRLRILGQGLLVGVLAFAFAPRSAGQDWAAGDTIIYATDYTNSRIWAVDVTIGMKALVTSVPGINGMPPGKPDSLIFAPPNNRIIYTLEDVGELWSWDGSTNTLLVSGLGNPGDLTLEPSGNSVLISDVLAGKILRYTFGSPGFIPFATGFIRVDGITYDNSPAPRLFAVINQNEVVELNPVGGAIINRTGVLTCPGGRKCLLDGMTFDPKYGYLWVSAYNVNSLLRIPTNLSAPSLRASNQIPFPDGLESDGNGNIFVASSGTNIYQYDILSDMATKKDPMVPGLDDLAPLIGRGSPTPGYLEICKTSCPLFPVTGLFTFTATIDGFNSGPLSVPVNACTGAVQVPAGTVTINEAVQLGIDVTAISAYGYNINGFRENRLVSDNLPFRTAEVTVVPGDASLETIVTFTNCKASPGLLKICKIAGPGVKVGTYFGFETFNLSGGRPIPLFFSVPAGPAPDGYCVQAGTYPVGTQALVQENVPSGISVTDITVTPPDRGGNQTSNSVTVAIDTGVTEVTFTDSSVALRSCTPTSSMGVLIQKPNVTAYVALAAWSDGPYGIQVVPIEPVPVGNATAVTPTPAGYVDSCASNSVTGETVCVSWDSSAGVYLVTGSTLNATLTSGATGYVGFSGGLCYNCGVAIDAVNNQAVLEVGLSGSPSHSGLQVLDLAHNLFAAPFPLNNTVSEDIQIDPFRNLIFSPSENFPNGPNVYDLITRTGMNLKEYSQTVSDGSQFDSAAEDCATGIALSTVEGTGYLYISDVTQATYSGANWTAPGQLVNFPEFIDSGNDWGHGTDGIAVAPGSHLAIVTGEFSSNGVGVVVLPSSSGSGTPTFGDYAAAVMPDTPDGRPFGTGQDPHTVTAYVSPNDGRPYGVVSSGEQPTTYLGIIDLQKLLAAPRCNPAPGHQCALGPHDVDPTYDLLGNGVVRYVSVF